MKSIQIKFLPLLALAFGVLFFTSCSKDDVNETVVQEEEVVPEVEEDQVLTFTLIQDGVETVDITTNLSENTECLFGRANPFNGRVDYMVGNGGEFQLLWWVHDSDAPEAHTYVDETGGIGFGLLNPCAPEETGPIYNLRNHTIVLDEVGEVGELMTGSFEGELAIGNGPFAPFSGTFSVPRI